MENLDSVCEVTNPPPSPTGADISWLLHMYGQHKRVVRNLLECFLVSVDMIICLEFQFVQKSTLYILPCMWISSYKPHVHGKITVPFLKISFLSLNILDFPICIPNQILPLYTFRPSEEYPFVSKNSVVKYV